ncbi:MAG TPA: flavodoxin family protein [Candidatus Avidesulfovibrio excrementigallinarum]|nr:flavodoxin family protein [Candidatus Avidesulfovibrio excrementigallinarum]
MHVLLINGSPHKEGCTFTALSEVAGALEKNGISTTLFHIGTRPVAGCIACGKCKGTDSGCVLAGEPYASCRELVAKSDGLVVGSPVYYAGPTGSLCALLDRLFFSSKALLEGKPAAAVVSCRRGGASATFDRLNKYFGINQMPIVTSQYWNSVHGNTPDEVRQDLEGMQTMRVLGNNMAWLLKTMAASQEPLPAQEPWQRTNFIR